MAAKFDGGMVLQLAAAPPVIAPPFSVALWYFPTNAVSNFGLWSLSEGATANSYTLRFNNTQSAFYISDTGSGAVFITNLASVVQNAWNFMLLRVISNSNQRLASLSATGAVVHGQNTTSRSPAGIDTMVIGAEGTSNLTCEGRIAEWWWTNTDIQADNAQLQNSLLLQLARGGPFSVPHIVKNLIEYRSFRKHPTCGELGEVHWGRFGVQQWTNNNGVTVGPHPPLSQEYVRPGQRKLALVV